ncbi:transcriptional regulator [Iodidimonas nitroreducens]|uniref:Transcriptional regulator n=1 Tax=Iodidimonas nitroreducens TaxID=1236968 RepID=A0A5A7NAG4_9PROT|nr:helix-turn-helix domain-containing protein [Iodidimonas nitroreducens]GAK33896.1 nitrogen fixation regulation protein FixK [alpha proteobacterium Q-1]GER05232.1 transcriptional regulator [Iodidimonas nitroreducens]
MTDRQMTPDIHENKIMCLACPARDSFLCSGLDDHELKHLAARATRFQVKRGHSLILEGDQTKDVYNVIEGDIALSRLSSDGRRQILGFLTKGDFIGLTLSDQYHFSADALNDARLCRFDRRSIEELIERFPGMDRQVRRMGASAMDQMLDLVFSLGRKTAQERVASFLIGLAHRQGHCHDPSLEIHLAMSRADIADYLGLTIETVSRIFSKLKTLQIIRLETAQHLHILDLPKLQSLAECELA